MKITLGATALLTAAVAFSFREAVAGSAAMWLGLGIPYLALSALALKKLHDDGTLGDVLRPKSGDISIGFLTGGILLGVAWLGRGVVLAAPEQMAWLYRLALQLGVERPSPTVLAVIALLTVLEELTWRGLVLTDLTERLGTRRAWPVAALLYGLCHAPTLFLLSQPGSGPNPLVLLGALGAGIVWSFMASFTGRLPPVIVSHAVFSYFAVTVLLPRLG